MSSVPNGHLTAELASPSRADTGVSVAEKAVARDSWLRVTDEAASCALSSFLGSLRGSRRELVCRLVVGALQHGSVVKPSRCEIPATCALVVEQSWASLA